MVELLEGLADELGRSPTQRDMDCADGYPSSETYRRRFGGWNDAKELAELDLHKESVPTENLIRDLRGASRLYEDNLTVEKYREVGLFGLKTVQSRFGSWCEAKEEAGIETTGYTDEELIDHLETVAEQIGDVPTPEQLNSWEGPSATIYYQRFDSLQNAREQAGLINFR